MRLPAPRDTPLFDLDATRRIEARALASAAPRDLMERAGRAAARLGLAVAPHARRVWVGCGPGHNGGDGLIAAAALVAPHREVVVTLDADPDRLPPDAHHALTGARAAGVVFATAPPAIGPDDLALDAWLGIGASREPAGVLAAHIEAMNRVPATIVALDVPSGLDAFSGQPFGACALRAHHTITFLTAKPGLFTGEGRDHAGSVWLDPLGVTDPEPPHAWLGAAAVRRAPGRRHATHKGRFGDVLVVGGAAGMTGALVLAARAAHAAGAGRVHLAPLDEGFAARDLVAWPELMSCAVPAAGATDAWHGRIVTLGCGGGQAIATRLPDALRHARYAVLDADALNAVAGDPALARQLAERARRGWLSVLTPHPLEAARLLGSTTASVQAARLSAARALADRFGAIVVLKGSGSVVAAPGEAPWINPTGSGALATAGTGDVLAGWIAGRWAGLGPGRDAARSVHEAVCEAVHLHGRAGEGWGSAPARAVDLIEAMHACDRGSAL